MPLDPRNMSGPEPNSIPYVRNDTISQIGRTNNPATFDRAESHKNNNHYEGDNARWSFSQSEPGYDNPYKQVSGVLDIGLENSLWAYNDTEIEKKLRAKIAKKFNVNPSYVRIKIDRVKGKIFYDRTQYVQAAEIDEIEYKDLEPETLFKLGLKTWPELSDKFKQHYERNFIWKKIDDRTAQDPESGVIMKMLKDYAVLVVKEKKQKRNVDKTKVVMFKVLPKGSKFVFVDMPQSLQYKNIPDGERVRKFIYDQQFLKINDGQAQAGDKVIQMDSARMQKELVIPEGEWAEKYQYKKENVENALDAFFYEYKTQETRYGEAVKVPNKKIFYDAMIDYGVSESQINSLSKEDKITKTWRGMFNGQEHNYVWVQNLLPKEEENVETEPEIEITRS